MMATAIQQAHIPMAMRGAHRLNHAQEPGTHRYQMTHRSAWDSCIFRPISPLYGPKLLGATLADSWSTLQLQSPKAVTRALKGVVGKGAPLWSGHCLTIF